MREPDLIRCRTSPLHCAARGLSSFNSNNCPLLSLPPIPIKEHLLWVHVGPSQPSLQTQVNDSPATTQVPPFSHGFGRQLEFLADRQKDREREKKFRFCQFYPTLQRIISAIINLKQSQETAVGLAFFGQVSVFSEGIYIPQL